MRMLAVMTVLVACGIAPLAKLSWRAKREREIAEHYAATMFYDFQYDEEDENYADATPPGPWLLRQIFGDAMFAQVRHLEIKKNSDLTDLDRLQEMKGLKMLVIYDCPQLENLDGLTDSQLQIFCIAKCPKLRNIDPLRGVTSLKFLNLWNCPLVPDVDALADANLTRFNLKGCPHITNIDSLQGHSNLRFCYLNNCIGLTNVDGLSGRTLTSFSITASDQLLKPSGLKNLGRVRQMDLIDCGIESLEEVWKYVDVKMLRLSRCPNLKTLTGVGEAISMETLTLSECPSLTSLGGLEKSGADAVYIFHCNTLENIKAVDAMAKLKYLRIEDCPQADPLSIEALVGMTNLIDVRVSECPQVDPTVIKALQEKTARRYKATAK